MHPRCLVARGMLFVGAALSALAPPPAAAFVPVTDAMLEDPAPGDWLTWRRTPDGWGYSPLDQIDRDNVGELRLIWSRALRAGNQEGTPLAYGGVPSVTSPAPKFLLGGVDNAHLYHNSTLALNADTGEIDP